MSTQCIDGSSVCQGHDFTRPSICGTKTTVYAGVVTAVCQSRYNDVTMNAEIDHGRLTDINVECPCLSWMNVMPMKCIHCCLHMSCTVKILLF